MNIRSILRPCVFSLLVLLFGTSSQASIQTQPASLNPGDPYRLAFVTSVFRNAFSSVIADYNKFVVVAANDVGSSLEGLGATWNAIGSTSAVHPRDIT